MRQTAELGLGVRVSMGVGATVDFLAGKVSRAPEWMRQTGLEWVYRLSQEPGRLWRRYVHDIGFLFGQLVRQRGRLRASAKPPKPSEETPVSAAIQTLVWTGELVAARLGTFATAPTEGDVRLDLSGVTVVDSSGLGWLLRFAREIWARRSKLVLVRPSPAVQRILQLTRMERLLPVEDESGRPAETPSQADTPVPSENDAAGVVVIKTPSQFDASEAADFVLQTRDSWSSIPTANILRLMMGGTSFMDSSGLGALIACHRLASERKGSLELFQVGENVRNVLRIARLEALLLGESKGC